MDKKDFIVIGGLIILSGLNVLIGSIIAPIETLFIKKLVGWNNFLIGLTYSISTLFTIIFSILFAKISLKISKKKIIFLWFLAWIFYPLICATSINLFQYLFGKILWTFWWYVSWILINSIFQDILLNRKAISQIAWYKMAFQAFWGTIGSLIGWFLADKYWITFPFFVIFVLYLINFLIFIYITKYLPTNIQISDSNLEIRQLELIFRLLKNRLIKLRLLFEWLSQSFWSLEAIIFPIGIFNLTNSYSSIGFVFSMMWLIATFLLPLAGKIVDKYGIVFWLRISFFFYILSFLILYFANSYYIFFIWALFLSLWKVFHWPSIFNIEVKNLESKYRSFYLFWFSFYDSIIWIITYLLVWFLLNFVSYKDILLLFLVITCIVYIIGYFKILKTIFK